MGLSNNALLIGAVIDATVCWFVCVRTARIYDNNYSSSEIGLVVPASPETALPMREGWGK
jgi:hypothetical protein